MPPSEHICSESFLLIQEMDLVTDYGDKKEDVDFETAVQYSGFGKFQYILLSVCGIIYATCAISTTTLSFVLPSAECDFNLSSADKGKLSAMPLIGMIFGCGIWGSLANCYGRKIAIMLSLFVDFAAAIISSVTQSFNLFLLCRFFNGFGIIGATSIIFSYLGEFLSKKHTDKMLGKLEIFWNIGVILLPGVAWAFLNKSSIASFNRYGNFSPWRIFVLVCSIPSLISLILIYFLPETPKYLISKGRFLDAKNVFCKMFTINTGQSAYMYPILSLEGEYENNNNIQSFISYPWKYKLYKKCSNLIDNVADFFSHQYLKYLLITCFADFGLMASYYTLIMWFPEIFDRFDEYERDAGNKSAGICVVSEYRGNGSSIYQNKPCDPKIENRVFIETIIIGLSCIPVSVCLSCLMENLGKKMVLVGGLIFAGIFTILLNWVHNSIQMLMISCVFEALTSILESVLFCVVVDIFPTNVRAMALAVTATSGRLGAIFGNVIFGLLIDLNCIIPIYLFGFLLIGSGVLCLAFPRNENYFTIV